MVFCGLQGLGIGPLGIGPLGIGPLGVGPPGIGLHDLVFKLWFGCYATRESIPALCRPGIKAGTE